MWGQALWGREVGWAQLGASFQRTGLSARSPRSGPQQPWSMRSQHSVSQKRETESNGLGAWRT